MPLSYAAVLKKAISKQPAKQENSHASSVKPRIPTTVSGAAAPSTPPVPHTPASTCCPLAVKSQTQVEHQVATGNSVTIVTNSRPLRTHDSSTHDTYFQKVLGDIQTEIANIGPYAMAERMRVPQRGTQAAHLIAMAQTQDEKRHAQALKKKVEAARAKFRLMKLPFEIRLKILDLAISPITGRIFSRNREHPLSLPPIARARNQDLTLESLIITIEKTEFDIRNKRALMGLQTWLSKIDLTKLHGSTSYKTGFDAVKALDSRVLDYYDFTGEEGVRLQKDCVLFMSKCENLRTAKMCLLVRTLLGCSCLSNSGFDYRPAPVETIVRECSFDRILSLPHLKTLHFEVDSSALNSSLYFEDRLNIQDAIYEAVDNLKGWFESEFEKRGLRVEIQVPKNPYH